MDSDQYVVNKELSLSLLTCRVEVLLGAEDAGQPGFISNTNILFMFIHEYTNILLFIFIYEYSTIHIRILTCRVEVLLGAADAGQPGFISVYIYEYSIHIHTRTYEYFTIHIHIRIFYYSYTNILTRRVVVFLGAADAGHPRRAYFHLLQRWGFRVWDSGCRGQGLGFGVQGAWFSL